MTQHAASSATLLPRLALALIATLMLAPLPTMAAPVVDCAAVFQTDKKETYKADPKDVQQCILRGFDPPASWKRDSGKSAGIKAGGAGGFSYGTISTPQNSPGARKVNASVSKDIISSSCNFPPRKISINASGVSFPAGSCLDFINKVFSDKDANPPTAPIPTGVSENDPCPVESDNTGLYGKKLSIVGGGSTVRECGGMVGVSSNDLVLNANPTGFSATENGAYYIWSYKKNGPSYKAVHSKKPLPTYLCTTYCDGDGSCYKVKTADLTPPVGQIINYSAGVGHISLRLKSRANMGANFVPPYDQDAPEKYLIIPIDANGTPQVPQDCDETSTYFRELSSRQDILIKSATASDCESVATSPTWVNHFTVNPDTNQKTDNWVYECPDGTPAVNNACPNIPPVPASTCPAPEITTCDTVTIGLQTGSCNGKMQYGVLNRPNLYYPTGTTSTFFPAEGRDALMASTIAGSQLFMQSQTNLYLQSTAPSLRMNEGGIIKLRDGSVLIMSPSATVDTANRKITMTGGGKRASAGGTELESFPPNSVYTIPQPLMVLPLEVRVGRSIDLPAGFEVPTAPTTNGVPPYIRAPMDKLP